MVRVGREVIRVSTPGMGASGMGGPYSPSSLIFTSYYRRCFERQIGIVPCSSALQHRRQSCRYYFQSVDDPSGMMYAAVFRHSQEHRLGKISIYVHYCRIVVLNFYFHLHAVYTEMRRSPFSRCFSLLSFLFLSSLCLQFLLIGEHYYRLDILHPTLRHSQCIDINHLTRYLILGTGIGVLSLLFRVMIVVLSL